MEFGLAGKRAFLPGSSSGIGAAVALALAKEGVEIILHGRSRENCERVAKAISAVGGTSHSLLGSLDDPATVDRLASEALAIGNIDILVNCAGAASTVNSWFDTPLEHWQRMYQFSTLYAVQMIRAIVPSMKDRGWGRVLNFSSAMAFKPMALHAEYAAAKLALHTVAMSLAAELQDSGVTVNTLACGLVMTENTTAGIVNHGAMLGFPETGEALVRRLSKEVFNIPLGRAGGEQEIAAAACFLVSEPAAYITGTSLRVDGGASGFVN